MQDCVVQRFQAWLIKPRFYSSRQEYLLGNKLSQDLELAYLYESLCEFGVVSSHLSLQSLIVFQVQLIGVTHIARERIIESLEAIHEFRVEDLSHISFHLSDATTTDWETIETEEFIGAINDVVGD